MSAHKRSFKEPSSPASSSDILPSDSDSDRPSSVISPRACSLLVITKLLPALCPILRRWKVVLDVTTTPPLRAAPLNDFVSHHAPGPSGGKQPSQVRPTFAHGLMQMSP